jgi:hypothetical protein
MNGTVVKDGLGLMKIGLGENTDKGMLEVAEGTLELMQSAVFPDTAPALDTLVVRAGATLKVPEIGLTVRRLEAEAGAVISGGGVLRVTETDNLNDLSGIEFLNGAKINFARGEDASEMQLEPPQARVV